MINEVHTDSSSGRPEAGLTPGGIWLQALPVSSSHPISSGFLWISPDPEWLYEWHESPPLPRICICHYHIVSNQKCASLPLHSICNQPEPPRLHAQCWICQPNWACLWATQRTSTPILGESLFPLVEHEDCWEVEADVENIKRVTSTMRGKSRTRQGSVYL